MAGNPVCRSPTKAGMLLVAHSTATLQQPLLSPRKEKGFVVTGLNPIHTGSFTTSGSTSRGDDAGNSTPRRSESSPNLGVGSNSPSPATPGKLKCERAASWSHNLWRWRAPGSPHPPASFSLQPSGLSWPAIFLLLAAVSALTALGTHTVFTQSVFPVRRQQKSSTLPSTAELRYWRKFEGQMKESAAPSPRKQGQKVVVLVTGAAGFVGSHVSLALKQRGDGVLGLDNFNNYYDPTLKRNREARLRDAGVFIVHADINNQELFAWLFKRIQITHIAHMAAQAGVRYAMENPQSYVHSNVAGFVSVLEAARKSVSPPSIVWASSSSVYGLNRKVPFSESHRTDRPASLYAATKKAGEVLAHSYNHIYGLSITGLRFFTVYGPWGRPDMAYFSFTRDILNGRPIKIFSGPGNGSKVEVARDFTYIDDIVNGCMAALDTAQPSTGGKKGPPAQLRIFNLGNTNPVSVGSLVSILETELKTQARKTVIKMPRNGDVPFTHANVTAANFELGYRPSTSLRTGLKKFVSWYLDHYGKNGTLISRK